MESLQKHKKSAAQYRPQPYPVAAKLIDAANIKTRWEVVYFVHPHCTGTCAHCWSADKFLGKRMPIEWHRAFWQLVDSKKVREVRLTGGEPFENPDLGSIVEFVCRATGPEMPINIFTSGRQGLYNKSQLLDVQGIIASLRRIGVVHRGVQIHLSADEHHAGSLYRYVNQIRQVPTNRELVEKHNQLGIPLMLQLVRDFLEACNCLIEETSGQFRGAKFKIHMGMGRGRFHRMEMYREFDQQWWKRYVDSSEGLFRSGRANENGTVEVVPRPQPALFIIPGAKFTLQPRHRFAQPYEDIDGRGDVFLDAASPEDGGACILGFSNLINNRYCGGSAMDALRLIGQLSVPSNWPF